MNKKGLLRAIALCLFLVRPLISFAAEKTDTATEQNWYKVRMPALIAMDYDQEAMLYEKNYEIEFCGDAPEMMLQVTTKDINVSDEKNNKLTLENYIGKIAEKSHEILIGEKHSGTDISTEWQSINGYTSHHADITPGLYTGTAHYEFKLIEKPRIKINGSKEKDIYTKAGKTINLAATFKDEDVSNKIIWTVSDENIVSISKNTLKISSSAQAGDTAMCYGYLEDEEDETITLNISVIDYGITDNNGDVIESVDCYPGDSFTLNSSILPAELSDNIEHTTEWSTSPKDGITIEEDGNTCYVSISEDITNKATYKVTAKINGEYNITIPVNVAKKDIVDSFSIDKHGIYITDPDNPDITTMKTWQDLLDENVITVENGVLNTTYKWHYSGVLVIDESVKKIANQSFNSYRFNSSLYAVIMPDTVTEVGEAAFFNNELFYVRFSKNLKTIKASAFYNAFRDTYSTPRDIIIPDSVTYIGQQAFWGTPDMHSCDLTFYLGDNVHLDENNYLSTFYAGYRSYGNEWDKVCDNTIIYKGKTYKNKSNSSYTYFRGYWENGIEEYDSVPLESILPKKSYS